MSISEIVSKYIASYVTLAFFWLGTFYIFWPAQVKTLYTSISNGFNSISVKNIKKNMSESPFRDRIKKEQTLRNQRMNQKLRLLSQELAASEFSKELKNICRKVWLCQE